MCRRLGLEAKVAADARDVEAAQRLILPGIGAFDAGARNLAERGFVEPLHRAARRHVPLLGICLGMQLMTEGSSEGGLPGLGWFETRVRHFTEIAQAPAEKIKVPHIGWNYIRPVREHPLLAELETPSRFYFVHSYCVEAQCADTLALSRYAGIPFAAMVARGNIVVAQFHPEKSHRFGMRLIGNFARWNPLA
jgi:glutamine amidotransferase